MNLGSRQEGSSAGRGSRHVGSGNPFSVVGTVASGNALLGAQHF